MMLSQLSDESIHAHMGRALEQAQMAFERNEVPIGAIVVHEHRVLGRGHNLTEALHDAGAHAEMIAMSAAYKQYEDWRLEGAWLFSTIEPCIMCASAAVLSRIDTIVYGAPDPKFGGCESLFEIPTDSRLNHRCKVIGGVRADEAAKLMQSFFRQLRDRGQEVH